jgi:hypothetical protein
MAESDAGDFDGNESVMSEEESMGAGGRIDRPVNPESTLDFVTKVEIIEVLRRRMEQIDDPTGEHNRFCPEVVEALGGAPSIMAALVAELLWKGWEYPLRIVRGGTAMRLHKDLEVIEEIVDIVVMHNDKGETSFNPIRADLDTRPGAEDLCMEADIKALRDLRENMGRRAV